MVNTDTREGSGEVVTGRQTNWRFNRNGRNFNAHYHWTEQSSGLRRAARHPEPQLPAGRRRPARLHGVPVLAGRLVARPHRAARVLSRIRTIRRACASTKSSRRSCRSRGPATARSRSAANSIDERLRPQDFPGLTDDARLLAASVGSSASRRTRCRSTASAAVSTKAPSSISCPPIGAEPELADRTFIEAELLWRPIDRLRVDTSFLSTSLDDRDGRGTIFDEPHRAHALELSVHERDVAARDPAARGDGADGAVAPRRAMRT